MTSRLTIPEAIRQLFDLDMAGLSPQLKNKAMSLERNGLIKVEKESKVQRKTLYLAPGQLTVLYNALLLNAVFPDPKQIKAIFTQPLQRQHCAGIVQSMFEGSNSLMGIALSSSAAREFTLALAGDFDLYHNRLPNPFSVLPQLALGDNLSLMHALLAQSAAMSPADNLLLAYLQGDLDKAMTLLSSMDNDAVEPLRLHIEKAHRQAVEFDDLLEQFRNL